VLSLRRVFQNYNEAGSLNAMVNLFGFLGPEVFLTKSGDVGIVLEVEGVDYECLDTPTVDGLTKRLESALRLFDENYRVYQMLFKRNQRAIPHSFCGKSVIDAAIRERIAYFAGKADELFSLSIYLVVLCPALTVRHSLSSVVLEFPEHPRKSLDDLQALLSSTASVRLGGQETICGRTFATHHNPLRRGFCRRSSCGISRTRHDTAACSAWKCQGVWNCYHRGCV